MPPIDPARSPPTLEELSELFRAQAAGLAGAVRGVLGPGADVADVLQEAWLRAARALERGARPAEPVAWLFVLTLNLCRDRGRRRARRGPALTLEDSGAMQLASRDDTPDTAAERAEVLGLARAAIHRLRAAEREVFLLRVSGELGFAAIGEALGIPVGTAKTRMRTALRELRAALGPHLASAPPETTETTETTDGRSVER
jgi:RNA polymerase sigma-70 factor (ECF subfamily)